MSDSGDIVYVATNDNSSTGESGLSGVFLNDTVLMNLVDPITAIPGQFSYESVQPGITASGMPYWVGAITPTPGIPFDQFFNWESRALFTETGAVPILQLGDFVAGVNEPLTTPITISRDNAFSAQGTNYITCVDVESSPLEDIVMVSNGAAMSAGGALIRDGGLIPESIGGIGDNYFFFFEKDINEAGDFLIAGRTTAPVFTNEILMYNGEIILRANGDIPVGPEVGATFGFIDAAVLNEDGDWAAIWNLNFEGFIWEILVVNGEIVLVEADDVDLDGDGVPEADAEIDEFLGDQNYLAMSPRNANGEVTLHFVGLCDIGTESLESAMELTVDLGEGVLKGDVNLDGTVSLLDVGPFVEALSTGDLIPQADVNCDGVVDLLDVGPFVAVLSGG